MPTPRAGIVKCYLTKRSNGRCLLTYYKPKLATVGETERLEAWPIPGDPISFDCCFWAATTIFGAPEDQQELETIIVRIQGVRIDKTKRK